jgi:D-sedoheptulose 7-phosphate isomerase
MGNEKQDPEETARRTLEESAAVLVRAAEAIAGDVSRAAGLVTEALGKGSKVLLCGNGGSAADAQHIAAELAGRLRIERRGLPALALTVNPSVLTALANDYGYEMVFARQVQALGLPGDILIGISTSGSSANVVKALAEARTSGLATIGFMGEAGGAMEAHCDVVIKAPSRDTQRIQEVHIAVGHALCETVEQELFRD